MSRIELDRATREALARDLLTHLKRQHDLEIAPFDALDLLDHLAETLGPHFYNQALMDAQAAVQARAEAMVDAIADLEKR